MTGKRISLRDKEATGGDTAEKGLEYQDYLIVAMIPAWLRNDGFSEMIREALGDTEAKFFAPGFGEKTICVEFKDHTVQPKEFWEEIDRFHKLHQSSPLTYDLSVMF